ncbi:MAG TPA: ribose-phosphate pyrophosphokinase [Euzebyales bacterium]|nr:ribose-phosphate pyrophosphokinase [Euzebyales bacterium]
MLSILAGEANRPLAAALAVQLETDLAERTIERFPDGEIHVAVKSGIRGHDVHIVQPLCPPVDAHLVETMMLADASHRAGAAHITAVLPYYGYARQDRRSAPGEPVGARVVADLLAAVHVDSVLVVDPHTRALEAMLSVPLEPISAIPLLAATLRPELPDDAVVVAPDLGAVKRAERFAGLLDLPMAFVRKTRLSGDTVRAEGVVGDVAGRVPVIVDDMITTGGTIVSATQVLLDAGARAPVTVAATHGLLVGDALEALGQLPLQRIHLTDSVPPPDSGALPLVTTSLGELLADAIRRLRRGTGLGQLGGYG